MGELFEWLTATARFEPVATDPWGRTPLLLIHVAAGIGIAFACFAIRLGLIRAIRRRKDLSAGHRRFAWLFGAMLVLFGLAELINIAAFWMPVDFWHALVHGTAALGALATVVAMRSVVPELARFPSPRQLAEANRLFRNEVESHDTTYRELEALRAEFEQRVHARTEELDLVRKRFEAALRQARVYVFFQDRELRFTWVYNPAGAGVAGDMVGRNEEELLTSSASDQQHITSVKRRVLETGIPESTEVTYMVPEGRAIFSLYISPTFGADGSIDGLMCTAIDITRIRTFDREQRRLIEELGTSLQRYETALRRSNVTVFTQDRALRYSSISNPLFGRPIDQVIGRSDDEVIPQDGRDGLIALKREAMESGQARNGEVCIDDGQGPRWFDFHIEPLRDVAGSIVGLTGASVDVTDRKRGEAHLRLLMRELTHRSKNLLAVAQAMSRQTARHTGSVEEFVDRFSARLQALARSHDLLIQEGWHGASLEELVRAQIAHYVDASEPQIVVSGPPVLLTPEAAQNLGLALHELATNAVKHGALSEAGGRVEIGWRRRAPSEGGGIEIAWTETGGPAVSRPKYRGFGMLVIERNLNRSLDADVQLEFRAAGLRCRIAVPEAHIAESRADSIEPAREPHEQDQR